LPPPRRPPVDSGSVQGRALRGLRHRRPRPPPFVLAGWLLITLVGLYLLSPYTRRSVIESFVDQIPSAA